jgi:hypothetical protein
MLSLQPLSFVSLGFCILSQLGSANGEEEGGMNSLEMRRRKVKFALLRDSGYQREISSVNDLRKSLALWADYLSKTSHSTV